MHSESGHCSRTFNLKGAWYHCAEAIVNNGIKIQCHEERYLNVHETTFSREIRDCVFPGYGRIRAFSGNHPRILKGHTEAQITARLQALVFLVVCLNGSWKVPITYFLTHGGERANIAKPSRDKNEPHRTITHTRTTH